MGMGYVELGYVGTEGTMWAGVRECRVMKGAHERLEREASVTII